ncbi:heavy metal-associated isoprenylated plant protein 3 [Mercurialis annua]|uniref:heavy metal-associated isoprenylated plant protein 3 n=1 Tax=Mercurialis annua TaxID=3986 RepID=UPI00215E7FB5|nr:heavy metal-associated isoprenylated plant protein 3 [Mercurialis annua]
MGKKKNKSNNSHEHEEQKHEEQQKKEDGGENKKKEENNNKKNNDVVFKIEMHCDGCASKIIKLARGFDGVENVKADSEANKLTVMGKVNDPIKIRDFLHLKTKKKVELISPLPKKDDANKNKDDGNKKGNDNNTNKPKVKEAPVVTAVIKVAFHCLGCIEKIQKIVSKTKGVQEMTMDKPKETVTVKGTMDVKALTEVLKEKLKRNAEIVPPKKDKEDGGKDGGEGGKKKKGGGGGGDGGGNGGGGDAGVKMEGRMEYVMHPGYGLGPGYGYVGQPVYGNGYLGQPMQMQSVQPQPQPVPVYGNGYMPVYDYGFGYQVPGYPVHMKFNDENPNACSIM